jgi:hypothetical protein
VSASRGAIDGTFLGALEYFAINDDQPRAYDFSPSEGDLDSDTLETIQEYRKAGRICAVYLPILVFGPSPRSGLSYERRQILIALTRETTRSRRSERQDRAAVVVGGALGSSEKGGAACPYLEPGVRYVGFNGNGKYKHRHLRGRGYSLVGRSKKGWLPRAGFTVPADAKGEWKSVQRFLNELLGLAEPFGLVVAAYHPAQRQWKPLEDLVAMTRTAAGRGWLRGCQLRVYTREDYLARWRQYFANRLGFSAIPGGDEDVVKVKDVKTAEEGPTIGSALELDAWMQNAKVTDAALAAKLGVSRSYVSRLRSGRRPWSKAFEGKLALVLGGRPKG